MEHRSQVVFLFLILTQVAHSIEEYITGLYQVFAPARFMSSLVSNNLPLGFLVGMGDQPHTQLPTDREIQYLPKT